METKNGNGAKQGLHAWDAHILSDELLKTLNSNNSLITHTMPLSFSWCHHQMIHIVIC